jgi:D-alanyl-lipoteichoic acid acyltransferase DltB (MBOAT superfamily)
VGKYDLKIRNWLLIAASCYFYMSFIPVYILILAVNTLADYAGSHLITKYWENKKLKILFFVLPLVINVGILIYFKYMYFIGGIIDFFGMKIGFDAIVLPKIILPIGISFHAFQSMGYLIDVYIGKIKAEKNLGTFALFLMFFPQLVAGPIERTENLMGQFAEKHRLSYKNISQGGRMMLWGMVKKILIADNLALFVDAVYKSPQDYGNAAVWIAAVFFAFQIYCDFSGYSEIAIGAAQIMGFKLMKNFDTPYFATSMTAFWRRWHISLSTWFKDYVYIPLGGNRVSRPRWCLNQIITFSISGLWHGASFTFVIWGFLHGLLLIIEKLASGLRAKVSGIIERVKIGSFNPIRPFTAFLCVCYTFFVSCFLWVLFRAESFGDAFYVIKTMFSGLPKYESFGETAKLFANVPRVGIYAACFGIIMLLLVDFLCRKSDFRTALEKVPFFARLPVYALFVILILVFGAYETKSFIYFQF